MASFDIAKVKILKVEGDYQDLPNDYGNYNVYDKNGNFLGRGKGLRAGTNFGISAYWWSDNRKKEISVAEMKALTKTKAIELYRIYFWNKIRGNEIDDQLLSEICFDAVVNHGLGGGTKHIQKALNKIGANLQVDGGFGNLTLTALKNANPVDAYNAIREQRLWWYNNVGNPDFRNGWNNRMLIFPIRSRSGGTPQPLPPNTPNPQPPPVDDNIYSGGNLPGPVVTASKPKSNSNGVMIIGTLVLIMILK